MTRSIQGNKKVYTSPPIFTKALPEVDLYFYLSASPLAIGAALVREDSKRQKPIYYVSHSLRDVKTKYPNLEKLAYALVIASRKLRQ